MTKMHDRWVSHESTEEQQQNSGVIRRVLAYSEDVMCVENTFKKGQIGEMHSHPHTQITYIVSGVFEFTIGAETRMVKAGDTLLKENGVIHGCICKEAGVLLDIFAPYREEFV